MNPDELLAALARHLGLPRLTLNADGACAVRLADGLDLDLQVLTVAEEMRWTLPLGQPDPAHMASLLAQGLLANTTLASTTPRHLAWEAASQRVVLCQTQSLPSMSPDTLGQDLDTFVAACRSLRAELQRDGVFQTSNRTNSGNEQP